MDELSAKLGGMSLVEATPQHFRFFDLPYELRFRILELTLLFPKTLDLDPTNYRNIARYLGLFLVSHRMHDEASRVFYARNTFRVFPIHGRFFHTKKPLLARLPPLYRSYITKLELRLGPGWTKPPKGWVADERLGLADAVKVRLLKIFVECDPAGDMIFEGFRIGQDFYTEFCVDLLRSMAMQVPSLQEVEFDAYPSVQKSSPLLLGLTNEVTAQNKKTSWGPERGWDKIVEVSLASVMQTLTLGAVTSSPPLDHPPLGGNLLDVIA
jgi:hypothetical protein